MLEFTFCLSDFSLLPGEFNSPYFSTFKMFGLGTAELPTTASLFADLYESILVCFSTLQLWLETLYHKTNVSIIRLYILAIECSSDSIIRGLQRATISAERGCLYTPSNYLLYCYDTLIIVLVFILSIGYAINYGLRNTKTAEALSEGGVALYSYLDEIEEECGQIEDAFIYLIYFLVFVLWFYFFNIYASYIISCHINWLFSIFCFIVILGFVIPSSILLKMGSAFAQYVRGAGRGTSLFFETLLDFVSVSVIIIRFFVQNVRFVFIFIAFFEFYEFTVTHQQPLANLILPHITWEGYWANEYRNWYWFEFLAQLLTQIIMYVYYIGHLTITYIAQLAIYLILSFWIFFFLYTTFIFTTSERFFFYKRCVLMIKD